jgi:hypothetical protein
MEPMMTVFDELLAASRSKKGKMLTTFEIKSSVALRFGTNRGSVIPSDYCCNKRNKDSSPLEQRMSLYIERGKYEFVGLNYSYTGPVSRTKGAK